MAEEWDFYLTKASGNVASVYLNLALHREAPNLELPWSISLTLRLQDPDEHGLTKPSEAEGLWQMEDKIVAHMSGSFATVFVGRVTVGGSRNFFFYAPAAPTESSLADLYSIVRPYETTWHWRHDPGWDVYLSVLYPSPEEMELVKNHHVLEALQKEGDVHTLTREVDHWFFFANEAQRFTCSSELQALGFTVRSEHGDGPRQRPFVLQVYSEQSVDYWTIGATTIGLFRLAKQHDGEYDGWEAPVMNDSR